MGNDGGSIPKRRELVKEAARLPTAAEAKETAAEAHSHAWRTCALSQAPLRAPIVSDCAGALYNKDAVLEFLLPADDDSDAAARADAARLLAGRVAALRDVVDLNFHTRSGSAKAAGTDDAAWVCPLSSKPLGSAVKSAYIVPCGHVFAEAALREVAENVCMQCNAPHAPDDIVTILPTKAADKERLQARIDALRARGLSHSLKKVGSKKKRKNAEAAAAAADVPAVEAAAPSPAAAAAGIKNAATASLTAKVLAEHESKAKAKRRRLADNDNLRSLFSSSDKKPVRDGDFMTRGFSIPANSKP